MKNIKKIVITSLILMITLMPVSSLALSKEEVVYAKLNSDGSTKSILVNEHLINDKELDKIEDMSSLENILNINSDHTYTRNNKILTWNSKGKDIFYQGISNKELPVSENITYKLNGKEISLKKLLGKNGKVEIIIKYQNKDKHIINNKTLYTPFFVTTATMLDTTNNSNIVVSNGKVVNNGNKFIIVGISIPGLYESLELDEVKDLDTITISFDTKKFELTSIYSVITSKLIDSSDLDIFDKLNYKYESINKLQESMNQIENGSKTILSNISLIDNGSRQIVDNLNTIVSKVEQLKDGTNNLDNGLEEIIISLNNVINTFNNSQTEEKQENIKMLISKNEETINELINNNKEEENNNLIYLLTKNNEVLNESLNELDSIKIQISTLNYYLNELKNGTNNLNNNAEKLYNGLYLLNNKMGELVLGNDQLKNGMDTLNNGIIDFNNDGIKVLNSSIQNIRVVTNKINSLIKLGEDYQTFDIKQEEVESSTKFIYVVDGVKSR